MFGKILIYGGRVWRSNRSFAKNCPILIENGKISAVGDVSDFDADGAHKICAEGLTVVPGLIDIHTHGRAGYDFCDADAGQMSEMKLEYARHGVTSVFPTLASASLEKWKTALSAVQKAGFDGVHLEGRYLNPEKRGIHAPELLSPLDAKELDGILSCVSKNFACHITAAYELDGDGSFTACALSHGATLSLGHTAATYEQAMRALGCGVSSFTHLFNAMPALHHRSGGAVSAALGSDAWAEIICDGRHVSPDMVKVAYKCKGADRLVLVTDSMSATGCPDGEYYIAGQKVNVTAGVAHSADMTLAGSTLELLDGVRNLMSFASVSLEDALACVTVNPAKAVGIYNKTGSIDTGKRADVLVLDDTLNPVSVIAEGIML